MSKNLSIVLDDHDFLSELLGANDKNLKHLEKIIGIPIFSRGNELFLDSDDAKLQKDFQEMISRLHDEVKNGRIINQDLLRALYLSIHQGESYKADLIQKNEVNVPRSFRKIQARSYNQALYLEAIQDKEMIFGIGPAGTGKTFLAVATALREVLSHQKKKIILTRPVVEADESLGFLPGDLEQKIQPYLRPIYDALEKILSLDMISKLEESGMLEIAPLAYMRGRTLSDCFVILDEAQNTTRKQMMMFLTRIEKGTRAVITGDITQIDLPKRRDSGLLEAMELLPDIEEISFVYFNEEDVIRSPLVKKIVKAYRIKEDER
ncbi:MAG: PhoH family protein [Spirochaetales bacterium]|nr:PhoH family protein [Spirochaetales bacterium]